MACKYFVKWDVFVASGTKKEAAGLLFRLASRLKRVRRRRLWFYYAGGIEIVKVLPTSGELSTVTCPL